MRRISCDVGEAMEGLENEHSLLESPSVASPTSQLILQSFCRFPHVAAHSLTHGCANHATEGEALQSPIHCCDVTNPPYLFSGELCTSTLHHG